MAKTILAVDDSKTMREMVAFTLRNAGFEVRQAQDGQDALRVLEQDGKIDLIITDLNMPNMDGLALITHLRAGGAYKNTPILMLTTETDLQKKEKGKAAGATGWLSKPFNPEKLVQVVDKVCA